MSIAAIGSFGSSAWNVGTTSSVGNAQQATQTQGSVSIPQGTTQGVDEYIPQAADAEETAATYKPPEQEAVMGARAAPPETRTPDSTEGMVGAEEETESSEGSSIALQVSNDSTDAEAVATASMAAAPVATEASEESDSSSTIGKPSWISDANWAEIQENPNQQPSDMSDEDWQSYLEWAGKSVPSSEPRQQAVFQSESTAVTEGTPPSAVATAVTTERAESTTRETTTQSALESGNRFNEYANRYSRWNSGNMNVGNQLNVTT